MRGTAASYHPKPHSRTTYTVLALFLVAVVVLAFLNEPLLVSRVQTVSLNVQNRKKERKFRTSLFVAIPICCSTRRHHSVP